MKKLNYYSTIDALSSYLLDNQCITPPEPLGLGYYNYY